MIIQLSNGVAIRSCRTRWLRLKRWTALVAGKRDSEGKWSIIEGAQQLTTEQMYLELCYWVARLGAHQSDVNTFAREAMGKTIATAPPAKPKKAVRSLRQPKNPHMQLSDESTGKYTHEVFPDRH